MKTYCILTISQNDEHLNAVLGSLLRSDSDLKLKDIYVIDLGLSSEIKKKWPVHYIRETTKFNFAYLFNSALKEIPARKDIFFIGDQGILLTKNGIDQLKDLVYSSPTLGLTFASIHSDYDNSFQSDGNFVLPTTSAEIKQLIRNLELAFLAVYIKREILNKICPFPDNFVALGNEENYFCNRLFEMDYELIIHPDVTVVYLTWEGYNFSTTFNQQFLKRNERVSLERLGELTAFYRDQEIEDLSPEEINLLKHVKQSIVNAYNENSKIDDKILSLEGMSSLKGRHLLNNLCSLENTKYLEIGVWRGSTLISALYKNHESLLKAYAIDNWSEYDGEGSQAAFQRNISLYLEKYPLQFFSGDSFEFNVKESILEKINIYFYDGLHTKLAQELAYTYYDCILDDTFITIVDDWIWEEVREGTLNAFKKLNYKILFMTVLPGRHDRGEWWNGWLVAVIRKQPN